MNLLSSTTLAAFGGLGVTELAIILVIVLIIFGAGKLPQIGDALGKGIRNFKKASNNTDPEVEDVTPNRRLSSSATSVDEAEVDEVSAHHTRSKG